MVLSDKRSAIAATGVNVAEPRRPKYALKSGERQLFQGHFGERCVKRGSDAILDGLGR